MRMQGKIVATLLVTALCGLLATLAYTQQPTAQHQEPELNYFTGETKAVGDGVAYSWVRLNNMNRPISIGVTFTESALSGLPDASTEYYLQLPEVATHAPFNHFALDWNPQGHFPQQFYGVPHFDFHFYMISSQQQGQITTTGADAARVMKKPAAQYIPQGYQLAPPAVPLMGMHWVRPDFPEFHGHPFTQSLIYGSYNGRISFIEPMITRAFFLAKTNVDQPIYQPKAFQVSGYYPIRYSITYDATRHLYTVALVGLTYRQAR